MNNSYKKSYLSFFLTKIFGGIFLFCIPLYAMEQISNQEVFAPQEVSALATISVAHHATQQAPAKKFICPACGKNLTSKINLTCHRRIHGKKPFKCNLDDCTFAAAHKGDLTAHQRTHTGEKPFKCKAPGCTYAAAVKGNLAAHQRRIHHIKPKRTLDKNINLEKNKRHHPEKDSATETELEENLS